MNLTLRIFLLSSLAVMAVMPGCSDGRPKRVPVSGQVLIDGKPLEHGFVQVIPANDRAASGQIGSDGRFTLTTFTTDDGCVPGNHVVTIIANESIDPQSQRWHAPKKYCDPTTSDLKIDIVDATDDLVINISWDGGEPFVERFDAE
ncbi:MAG: hypothetical protein KDA66_14995 [Planctomycetaceae bacterium]|nr:hypothetical protein [Planctomycetaceae bacterium]